MQTARSVCLLVLTAALAPGVATAFPRPRAPVVRALDDITHSVRVTRYAHTTRVDVRHGLYVWDCSGMVAWVLTHSLPEAERAVEQARNTRRPLARDYHAFFAALPASHGRAPTWQRVPRMADAEPGDVVGWVFPPWVRASITGHVAFVVARPTAVTGAAHRYRVRLADSTSVPHADDTRPRTTASGFGTGVVEFTVDPRTGAATAYRWNDRPGRGFLRTSIMLARAVPPRTGHRALNARQASSSEAAR